MMKSDVVIADGAMKSLAPGRLIRIGEGALTVDIAPAAGGRVAQITHEGIDWLVGYSSKHAAMIAWGSYPMVPWAGRLRNGRFAFRGKDYALPLNLGEHAIHGIGLDKPWHIEKHSARCVELSLQLPADSHWPFGGIVHQRIEIDAPGRLMMQLSVTAPSHAMPVVLGWHPWFQKPDDLQFSPEQMYPRDAEGMATLPLMPPSAGPWDDCFVNHQPVFLRRGDQTLRLTSDCRDWVVYDATEHATCVEPQSGPPDAFNLAPVSLEMGQTCSAWFLLEWP